MNKNKLAALVNKQALEQGVLHQNIYDLFFFEHFLYRVSKSPYKSSLIFKGGFLLEAILGVKNRTTKDLDLEGLNMVLDDSSAYLMIDSICKTNVDDGIEYKILSISQILANDIDKGRSVFIEARYMNLRKRFSIDIGTGDIITPNPMDFEYVSSIDDMSFQIKAYNIETIMAEKFQILISRGENNSRMKDYYDLYLLLGKPFNEDSLRKALFNTFHNRSTSIDMHVVYDVIENIENSLLQREMFSKFIIKSNYAKHVGFDEVMSSIKKMVTYIS